MNEALEYTRTYKYLGYHIQEHLSQEETAEILTKSAKRAFGRIISMFYTLKNMGYGTYMTLYNTNIMPIANYASGIWGYKDYQCARMLQNKCHRFYLGTHTFTPTSAVCIEMDTIDIRNKRWIEMVRLKNRFAKMKDERWPKRLVSWDLNTGTEAWAWEIKQILTQTGCPEDEYLTDQTNLDQLQERLLQQNRRTWNLESYTKTKLRTFVQIHDYESTKILVNANLDRRKRSLVAKYKAGVFPIRLETGRYKGLKEEKRLCQVCDCGAVENEIHFTFHCKPLQTVRKNYMQTFLAEMGVAWPVLNDKGEEIDLDDETCISAMYKMVQANNIRKFSEWLEQMYLARRNIIFR